MEHLTDVQQKFLDWAANPAPIAEKGSQQRFADAHGVTSETLRRWKKTEWFRGEMDERLHDAGLGPEAVQQVVIAAQQRAAEGDVAAMKTYLQLLDRVNPIRVKVDDGDLAGIPTDELMAMLDGAVD
jgi:hypothetical protein